MNKYFKLVFIIIVFIILGFSLYHFSERVTSNNSQALEKFAEAESASGEILGSVESKDIAEEARIADSIEQEKASSLAEEKYELLKDNQLYKRSIESGDSFFVENKLISALKDYQTAKKIIPDDMGLDVKIGDVYYELKNYKLAFKHFKGNDQAEGFSKEKELLSLFYSHYKLGTTEIEAIKNDIQDLSFNEEERIYYLNSLQCAIDFSKCKLFFQDFFLLPENSEVTLPQLVRIKEGIEAYEGSGIDDINYKNGLVIGKFFENEHYPLVIKLGNDLLGEFPNYEAVIQMVAKSYYELGLYDEANAVLKPLHERKLDDEKISYFMGIISLKRKYFLSSNIYFNKALESGYEPKIAIKRKLVYNYFLLDNEPKMYSMLDDLLYEEGVEESDFALGIYQALQDKKMDIALAYAQKGSIKFPESARFYGYIADIHMKMGNLDLAKDAIGKGTRLNPKEVSIVYYEGKIFMEEKEYDKAFIAFRRVIGLSKGEGEFVSSAKNQLQIISEER